jgi:hypothetical protein
LNNLSQESAADPTLKSELAEAYRRLGEIQGHPSFPIWATQAALSKVSVKPKVSAKSLSAAMQTTGIFVINSPVTTICSAI